MPVQPLLGEGLKSKGQINTALVKYRYGLQYKVAVFISTIVAFNSSVELIFSPVCVFHGSPEP